MRAQYTKGPWKYSKHRFNLAPFEGTLENEYGIYPPLGESGPVAIVAGKDDARLIATAPEMLEVLQGMRVDACEDCEGTGNMENQATHDACPICGGTGMIVTASDPNGIIDVIKKATQGEG